MIEQAKRGVLLALAVEGVVPVVGGCAGALAGGPEGGVVGIAVGQAVEKAINFFGGHIVECWGAWFRQQPPEVREEALAELAAMPAEEARRQAESLLDKLVLEPISQADRDVVVGYLSLLPGSLDRALPRDAAGARALPPTVSLDEPQVLLSLLPMTLPPYPVGSEVPGTPYRLDALLGQGGFGAVYRASTRTLQHLPLAVKFCLDPTLRQALERERANLERLMKAGGESWSPRVVRLYGYDLEHPTPYLVYEFVTGGDLIRHVAERRERLGRALSPEEVFELVLGVAEALAFAHEHGLVHRDLKPANVLVEGGLIKLADFGLGGVTSARATLVSRIGATTVDQLTVADQASLFRGAGTPLYMAPEQRRGQPPDPRHDLYSLGVMWYQLLVGDVSRELHPGWARELTLRHAVPRRHLDLIERCVGWFEERPRHAGELLALMRAAPPAAPAAAEVAVAATMVPCPPPLPAPAVTTAHPQAAVTQPGDTLRQELLVSLVKQLEDLHREFKKVEEKSWSSFAPTTLAVGLLVLLVIGALSHSLWASLLASLLVAAATVFVLYLTQMGKRASLGERRNQAIRLLVSEFPEAIRAWGGEVGVRNPEVVGQMARSLGVPPPRKKAEIQAEGPADDAPLPLPALDPAQRRSLAAQLRPLAEQQAEVDGPLTPRRLPFVPALLIGLVLGGALGVGIGCTAFAYWGPVEGYGSRGERRFSDYNENNLTEGAYHLEHRKKMTAAVAAGILSGAVVLGGVVLLLGRRALYRRRLLSGLLLGLLVSAPAGVGTGLLYGGQNSPSWGYGPGRGYPREFYDASGRQLDAIAFELEERRVIANTLIASIGLGLLLVLAVMVLAQRRAGRQALAARQQLAGGVAHLNAGFPQVVAACGGPEALLQPGQIARCLRAVGVE
jgi:serine/threonine protein kinase